MLETEQKEIDEAAERQAELDALTAISPLEFKIKVKEWMLLEDDRVLDLLLAHYVANKRPGDPVWLQVVGPSGGGKSELLVMFNSWPDYFPLSSLTPQTLVSGFNGKQDASMLTKMRDKIVSIKDFTTIMTLHKEARAEVFGQLREVFDGRLTKAFGNNKMVDWKGKIGMIAASTEVYDAFAATHAAMGERFIVYRLIPGDRKLTAHLAYTNSEKQKEMRWELTKAAHSVMKGIDLTFAAPALPGDVIENIIAIANLACLARSAVIRDLGNRHEILFLPAPEMPTRLTQQLSKLCNALLIAYHGETQPETYNCIYKVGLDSIPKTNRLVLRELTKRNNQTTADIARALGYPTNTVRTFLEDISMKGLALRHKGSDTEEGGAGDRWEMAQEYRDIFTTFDAIAQEIDPQQIAANFGGVVIPDM